MAFSYNCQTLLLLPLLPNVTQLHSKIYSSTSSSVIAYALLHYSFTCAKKHFLPHLWASSKIQSIHITFDSNNTLDNLLLQNQQHQVISYIHIINIINIIFILLILILLIIISIIKIIIIPNNLLGVVVKFSLVIEGTWFRIPFTLNFIFWCQNLHMELNPYVKIRM